MLAPILIIFFSFAGFVLTIYLHHKKKRRTEHFICPLRGNCSEVIHSDYSRFFGMPVELLGTVYYFCIAIGYGANLSFPESGAWLSIPLFAASVLAFMFSLYLTFIQVATIRKLCTWCLLSAGFCLTIFLLSLFTSVQFIFPFLEDYRPVFILLHVVFMALGLGAATLTDVFFFKFLKDFRISDQESGVLSILSEFIWFALGFLVLTGLALYLPEASTYNANPKFLAKVFIVLVIIINGAFLNLLVTPRLVRISFGKPHDHQEGELSRIRKIAFALGPISIISWYSAFLLGSLRQTPFTFEQILGIYAVLICIGVLTGQIVDAKLVRTASRQP